MVGRLLRASGSALVIAVAFVTPFLATASATPASADTVIDGCTVVSNPSPTHFTSCAGSDLAGADFSGLNLSYSDFAGSTFADCGYSDCAAVVLTDANLTDANLSGIVVWAGVTFADPSIPPPAPPVGSAFAEVDFTGANLSGANLTGTGFGGANLTDANLTDANLSGAAMEDQVTSTGFVQVTVDESATLTGANFTGTIVMPSNQSVTATSQAGAVATWSMPPAIAGTTPGACTPASGSTFPLFSSTVTCQVLDDNGDVATGTFQVIVEPTTQYFTRVLVPASGSTLSGRPYLDAEAGNGPGVNKVLFELSGGPSDLSDQVIATGTPTIVGWLAQWNSASVPNGAYTLESVAADADAGSDTSTAVSLTVDNPTPTTTVVLPAAGATLKGSQYLDATASSDVSTVTYELSGGPSDLSDQVIASATLTYVGWAAAWNTAGVLDGSYTLQSVASYAGGVSGTSAPISITVNN